MTEYAESRPTTSERAGYSGWVGWIAFAGMMMTLLGVFHIIQGFVALFNDKYFVVARSGLVVHANYTAWGWVHIIGGAVVLAAGFAVFAGQLWARIVGTVVALLSACLNIAFIGAYPLWSLMMIALDVIVIMALTVHGSEIRAGD